MRGSFSHLLFLLIARPKCPIPVVVEGSYSGQSPNSIQWAKSKGWDYLRANQCLDLIHPSSPGCSLSSASLLYQENSLRFVRSRRGLVSDRAVSLGWLLEGFRVWKLNRTYPGEKSSSLSLPTQTHTALAGNIQHLSEDGSILRGSDNQFSLTCPRQRRNLFQDLKKIITNSNMMKLSRFQRKFNNHSVVMWNQFAYIWLKIHWLNKCL